jgi:hypothetical protein
MIENVEISGNKAYIGAGVYIASGKLTISGGKITGNEAKFVGGGLYIKNGAEYEEINGASITGNSSGYHHDYNEYNVFKNKDFENFMYF